ncbi:MAG: hypothetical protein FWB98_09145, partial [Defluviitaleaceae bacterium]|nr:hypothetical protein [Defluviitaleaceae bacterium]
DCKEQGSVHTHRYVRVLVTQSIEQKDKFIVAVLVGNEYTVTFVGQRAHNMRPYGVLRKFMHSYHLLKECGADWFFHGLERSV